MFQSRTGQSTVEYAVLAAVVVGALLAMQVYVKRGTMGKVRSAADQIGDQYTPFTTTSEFNTTHDVTRNDVTQPSGLVTSTITADEKQTRKGDEHVNSTLESEKLF